MNEPWNPQPLVRLQIAFALVALFAVGLWMTRRLPEGTQQKAFRLGVTFIGAGGLIVATLLRIARNQPPRR